MTNRKNGDKAIKIEDEYKIEEFIISMIIIIISKTVNSFPSSFSWRAGGQTFFFFFIFFFSFRWNTTGWATYRKCLVIYIDVEWIGTNVVTKMFYLYNLAGVWSASPIKSNKIDFTLLFNYTRGIDVEYKPTTHIHTIKRLFSVRRSSLHKLIYNNLTLNIS